MFSTQLLTRLTNATSIAVLTGAGISAESGVPTFRGADGLWKKFRPEELANFDAFMRNPDLVWEWYSYRRILIDEVQPNAGHYALVEIEALFDDFTLVTQNVDNLHRRAGSVNVHELHGNILRNFCVGCKKHYDDIAPTVEKKAPRCVDCGALIRPDVVWFGEMLPVDEIRIAERAAMRAHVFFTIGTSGEVYPAAQLPLTAKTHGAYVVEINPEETMLTRSVDESIFGNAGSVLPSLLSELKRLKRTA